MPRPGPGFGKAEVLVEAGETADYAYAIRSGGLKMQTSLADGRVVIVDFRFPGEYLMLSDGISPWTIGTIEDTSLCRLRESTLTTVLRDSLLLDAQVKNALASELRSVGANIARLALMTPAEKIASFLLDLSGRLISPDNGRTLDLPMRCEEIGQHLGLTPETASRVLTRLAGEGAIVLPRPSRVCLLDLAYLRCLSEGGSPRGGTSASASRVPAE